MLTVDYDGCLCSFNIMLSNAINIAVPKIYNQ